MVCNLRVCSLEAASACGQSKEAAVYSVINKKVLGVGEVSRRAKGLLCKHGNPTSDPQYLPG